jgi:hypothetical protein
MLLWGDRGRQPTPQWQRRCKHCDSIVHINIRSVRGRTVMIDDCPRCDRIQCGKCGTHIGVRDRLCVSCGRVCGTIEQTLQAF